MFAGAFPQLASSPSLVWVVSAICMHIANTFLGLYMGFMKQTKAMVRIHLMLYFGILFSLAMYLIMNGVHGDNTIWDYGIGLYFITLLPKSAKWDLLIHALVAGVGLTLLPVLILLQI